MVECSSWTGLDGVGFNNELQKERFSNAQEAQNRQQNSAPQKLSDPLRISFILNAFMCNMKNAEQKVLYFFLLTIMMAAFIDYADNNTLVSCIFCLCRCEQSKLAPFLKFL